MKKPNSATPRTRADRGRTFRVETLENRTLLTAAVETFTGPSLTALIRGALNGKDTAPATIATMVQALETQLNAGPVANLTAATVTGNEFVTEAQSLEASYEQYADTELLPRFPNVDELIKLQGQAVVADLVALNQENTVGLLSDTDFSTQAGAAADTLTAGPVKALGTPLSGYTTATQTLDNALNVVAASLSSTASPALTPAQASTTVLAEAEAYRATVHAGLQVTHGNISGSVDDAVTNLETSAVGIANDTDNATAQTQLDTAIATFDAAVLGTAGVFSTDGLFVKTHGSSVPTSRTASQPATTLFVAGTSSVGGPAVLTATLTSTATGLGIGGQVVSFTLDGAFAGLGVTNSNGVATLSDVLTSDVAGTDASGVVATYSGNPSNTSSIAVGNLVVTQTATTLSAVGGTAVVGGTATLTATLTNSATSAAIPGEEVDFTLDGTPVGSVATDSNGVATLTGVATTQGVGTDTGGVVASFAGDDENSAATATGDLVVSQNPTALSSVGGTAVVGGTATLTATLLNSTTNAGIPNESVAFTLNGAAVGSATTNSSGVATLTGIASSAPAGTQTGVVSASFAGDTDNAAATPVTGNLVTSQVATSLTAVSGTATAGGTATLNATLINTATNTGIAGESVTFTLNGVAVGGATTGANGVATLTGVTSTSPPGTYTGAVVASFAGDATNAPATSLSGNLVVSQVATSLGTASATATFGGTATLTATLTNSATSTGIAGESVTFTLNGASVGNATTNGSGVATLTGIASSAAAGTATGVVGASFAGDTDNAASTATAGDLVTSKAGSSPAPPSPARAPWRRAKPR